MMARQPKAKVAEPAARPSSPSVRFTALEAAMITAPAKRAQTTMATPPMVGVPALVMWPWGPSSLMGWPIPWTWSQRMRAGVPTTDTTSETAPATRSEITWSPGVLGQVGQRRPRHLAVVEGHGAVGEHLHGLVALARQHHHVAGTGLADGGPHRAGPVGLDHSGGTRPDARENG